MAWKFTRFVLELTQTLDGLPHRLPTRLAKLSFQRLSPALILTASHALPFALQVWLEKMSKAVGKHPHYKVRSGPADRSIPEDSFILVHYAGEVVYSINGFLDKNTDTLFKDLSRVRMARSSCGLVALLQPAFACIYFDMNVCMSYLGCKNHRVRRFCLLAPLGYV